LIEPFSKNIETNTQIKESYFGAQVLSDTGGGVQRDGFPDKLYLLFGDLMCGEELAGGISAIDLEAFLCARGLKFIPNVVSEAGCVFIERVV
jgi:hypothetical protein